MSAPVSEEELVRIQQQLAPKEDLTSYVGRWVALRDGHVVAAAEDAVELRQNRDVSDDGAILLVSWGGR